MYGFRFKNETMKPDQFILVVFCAMILYVVISKYVNIKGVRKRVV